MPADLLERDDGRSRVRIAACTVCRIQLESETMKVDVSFCVPEWVYWQIEKARELRKLKIGSPALVRYPDLAQPRTIDLGHKVLQIHAGTREFKGGESREDSSCGGRR